MRALLVAAIAAVTGCAQTDSPQIACQQRLVAAREVAPAADDKFGYQPYAKFDRSGCSGQQLEKVDRLLTLTKTLPGLLDANERAASQSEKAHMTAFQRMNDALIELNDLQIATQADLDRMAQPK